MLFVPGYDQLRLGRYTTFQNHFVTWIGCGTLCSLNRLKMRQHSRAKGFTDSDEPSSLRR